MKKENYEVIKYIFVGGCTTILNLLIFYILTNKLEVHYMIANILAWFVGVTFAYISNKFFVFKSFNKDKKNIFREISIFFIARIVSLGIDQLLIYILIGIMFINSTISKILSNIAVVIVNYLFSKFITFKK